MRNGRNQGFRLVQVLQPCFVSLCFCLCFWFQKQLRERWAFLKMLIYFFWALLMSCWAEFLGLCYWLGRIMCGGSNYLSSTGNVLGMLQGMDRKAFPTLESCSLGYGPKYNNKSHREQTWIFLKSFNFVFSRKRGQVFMYQGRVFVHWTGLVVATV